MKKRMEELVKLINYYNKKYHEQDISEISDYEYDELYKELVKLEAEYPQFVSADSPTLKVGGRPSENLKNIKHPVPLESLSNAFSLEDLIAFDKRIKKDIEKPEYVLEKKLDGLSVTLLYENNEFVLGLTRGDGISGEDVTVNLRTIENLPKKLSGNKIDYLLVRGEVYMSKSTFIELNEEAREQNTKLFANPRNAAAGSLRQLDPSITKNRRLKVKVFNIQKIEGYTFSNHKESFDFLNKLGFPVNDLEIVTNDISKVYEKIKEINSSRNKFEFEIDGAVIKINNLNDREVLGSTAKAPRWAVAFKFPPEEIETDLLDIYLQIGRTGVLTPNALLKPVYLAGSTVSRASLHNMNYIESKDIRINDKVVVYKGGDIIPTILKSVKEKRNGKEIIFTMPSKCPYCDHKVEQVEDQAAYKCSNYSCIGQVLRRIEHFSSKDAMDIEGLSRATIELLNKEGFLNSIFDIYKLHEKRDKLIELKGFGPKKVDNLLNAIEASKNVDLDRLIFALGIDNVGKTIASLFSDNLKSLKALKDASYEELTSIETVGPLIAKGISDFFSNPANENIIINLEANNINTRALTQDKPSDLSLKDLTFVITGSFEKYKRSELQKILEEKGGKVTSSVSKNTDYVIAGENPGSKLTKAQELNIKVLSLEELEEFVL